MSGLSVASMRSVGGFCFTPFLSENHSKIEELAKKTQSIWEGIYAITIGNSVKIVFIVRNAIGSIVRDPFFFPLKWSVIAEAQATKDRLKIEEEYNRDFWDPSKPLDPNLASYAHVREFFSPPEDRTFSIRLKDGTVAEITCRVVQTKYQGDNCYNFVHIPGMTSTISNNLGTLPYLSAYLKTQEGDGNPPPPGRFIIISENNLSIKPRDLEEAGFIMQETLKALHQEFGSIDQAVAHSLGVIFLAKALKLAEELSYLPRHICLDRGPTSIYEASKKYFCGLWIYLLAKSGGWASALEEDISYFCKKWKHRPSLLITGVIPDHHFSGSANLCLGEEMIKLKNQGDVDVVIFDPPRQLIHENAFHSCWPDFFNSRYLKSPSTFIKESENLPEAIVRHSRQTGTEAQHTA